MQYNPSYVGHRPILSGEERCRLRELASSYPLARFRGDARNYEEMAIDFVYTSAKIEGNTYDRVDTDNLLRLGVTAGGKRYSDAVMLVNLREGFASAMATESSIQLDLDYLCDLHKVLMRDLLPAHEQGLVRTSAVAIGGSAYRPLSDPARLRSELRFILAEADKYQDVFERAIYLHCNLAYLQYFRDGNKRTARLMKTAALAQANVLPLFFHESLIGQYQRATVAYYETGDYAPYVSFFSENYRLVVSELLGEPLSSLAADEAQEFSRRVARLSDLEGGVGVARVFWLLAREAIALSGSAAQVNWPELERRAMVEAIGRQGQPPADVGVFLCERSPGACSPERQQAILDDVRRISPGLRAQQGGPSGKHGPAP